MNIFRYLPVLALILCFTPAFCQGQGSGFDGLDTNSDGKVTKEEFRENFKTKVPNFALLEKFVDRLDADKDGEISEDEFGNRVEVLKTFKQEMVKGETKKKMSPQETKMVDKATSAFDALAKNVSQSKWKEVAKGMTKKAGDEFAINTVGQSLTLAEMKLPPEMDTPEVKEAKDATVALIEKYGLAHINISSMPEKQDGDDDDEDKEMTREEKIKAAVAEAHAQQVKVKAEILKAIDKDGQRWEIVAAFHDAQKASPLSNDVFVGKVGGAEVDGDEVFLTMTQEAPKGKIALPIILKMTAEKGDWKYAGIDQARTQGAMLKMMQGMRKRGAPKKPDSDF